MVHNLHAHSAQRAEGIPEAVGLKQDPLHWHWRYNGQSCCRGTRAIRILLCNAVHCLCLIYWLMGQASAVRARAGGKMFKTDCVRTLSQAESGFFANGRRCGRM
jgi:hypothetical protein